MVWTLAAGVDYSAPSYRTSFFAVLGQAVQPALHRPDGHLGAAAQLELAEDVLDVVGDRPSTSVKRPPSRLTATPAHARALNTAR